MELYASGGNGEQLIEFILLYYYYDFERRVLYIATSLYVSGGVGLIGTYRSVAS